MLDRPQLRLAHPPVYTALDLDAAIRVDRRRTRKAIRLIWFTSMLITVLVCAALRTNPWVEIYWAVIPAVGVSFNALYFWGMIRLMFPSVPKEERA